MGRRTLLAVPPSEDVDHTRLRVVFRPTRTRRGAVVTRTRPPVAGKPLTDIAYEFVFREHPVTEVVLEVEYGGEPVTLSEAHWSTPDADDLPEPPTGGSWGADRREQIRKAVGFDPGAGGSFTDSEIAQLQQLEDPTPLITTYFTEVDHDSNPALIDPQNPPTPERLDDVLTLMPILVARLGVRLTTIESSLYQGKDPAVPEPDELPLDDPARVQRIADLLVGRMQQFFPGGWEGVDIGLLWQAYRGFATGTLGPCQFMAPHLYDAQPDSSYMYCWAEFAFLCLQTGTTHATLWERLAADFTCAEMLFLVAYGARGVGCTPPTSPVLPGWETRGPPVRPPDQTPQLQDELWHQLVRDLHLSPWSHVPLLHAQHLMAGCSGGIGSLW